MSLTRTVATATYVATLSAALMGCSATSGVDGRTDRAQRVSWQEAEEHAGERVRVCGPLRSTGSDGDDRFLNLGAPYPREPRFTIVVWDNPASIPRIGPRLRSYRVCVTGEVSMFGSVPQVELEDGSGIDVSNR